MFPIERPRRLRRTEELRGMVRETRLTTHGFVYPMFVVPGSGVRTEISSMPGIYQQSADKLVDECREVEFLAFAGASRRWTGRWRRVARVGWRPGSPPPVRRSRRSRVFCRNENPEA